MTVGRRPLPTAIKDAKGTLKYARVNNPDEPKPALGAPRKPRALTPLASEAWDRIVPVLDGMRVLTASDLDALVELCECTAEVRTLRDDVEREGRTWESENPQTGQKMLRANPKVAMYSDAQRRLVAMHNTFGLTPSARAKVKAEGPAKDPVDSFFTTGGTA